MEQREEGRVISRRGKQAGDIMWVRLPAPNIMVISREREREGEPSKLVLIEHYSIDNGRKCIGFGNWPGI